jgi:hypothetical protein
VLVHHKKVLLLLELLRVQELLVLEQLHDYRGRLAVALKLVLRQQQRVPVHDHHGLELELQQPRLARQANRANQLHEYRRRQEYHRDKLFSVSIVCSAR